MGGSSGKEHTCQCRRHKRSRFDSWVGKIPWRTWQPTSVLLPGESNEQRSLADYSPVQFNSVAQLCLTLCNPMDCRTPGFPVHQHTPRACSNSGPSSWWCHPTISFSAIPFSSCLQSFPASGSFPRSQFFASGGQSIGASASVLPMNIQDWFPLGLTGWISLQSNGLSKMFITITIQKHQFFGMQLSL